MSNDTPKEDILAREIWFMFREVDDATNRRGEQPTTLDMWKWLSSEEKEVWSKIVDKVWGSCIEENDY